MKNFKYIQKQVVLLTQFSQKYNKEIIPCTSEEVAKLESMLPDSYYLPEAYKEFLLFCGKESADIFYSIESGYEAVKKRLLTQNKRIIRMVQLEDIPEQKELPKDLFVIEEVDYSDNFTYLLLEEGEDPPIYFWEEGEGGLEFSEKLENSFSDYFLKKMKIKVMHTAGSFMRKKIKAGELPKGQQFWIPDRIEYSQGVQEEKLLKYLGFGGTKFYEVAKTFKIEPYPYLEELSGWKARKVGDEIRFFPPSYKSPEEKALEQQNQIESKKLELAKVEKIIANLTNRIKNLSGGKLTGGRSINFNNSSALRIKELELDLRKEKVNKQKLEKEITKLEENSK